MSKSYPSSFGPGKPYVAPGGAASSRFGPGKPYVAPGGAASSSLDPDKSFIASEPVVSALVDAAGVPMFADVGVPKHVDPALAAIIMEQLSKLPDTFLASMTKQLSEISPFDFAKMLLQYSAKVGDVKEDEDDEEVEEDEEEVEEVEEDEESLAADIKAFAAMCAEKSSTQ